MTEHFPALPYPWQKDEWQRLNRHIDERQLPHALMFSGPLGVGKVHLAKALAQRLLCQAPQQGTACGKCHSCGLLKAQTHPDLTILQPEEPGKAIKIDAVRELTRSLGNTAQQGGYKVVVMEPAEAMNINAANALLKTLEEPADNTCLILVSHTPSSVLPTIRSRCQIRPLPLPPASRVLEWLKPLVSGSGFEAGELLDRARGAPLTALGLLDGDRLEQRRQREQDFLKLCDQKLTAMQLADNWQKGDVGEAIEWLLGWLYDLARWQTGVGVSALDALPDHLRQTLKRVPPALLHRYLEKLMTVKRQWLSGANPNKQLLLEELLLDWGVLLRQAQRAA